MRRMERMRLRNRRRRIDSRRMEIRRLRNRRR